MIGRKQRKSEDQNLGPKGFDDYDLRLGDMMRGERATLGKSLLDVQRELRIRASFIAAIENSDPSAFETPGFIAGYVRSYARYLGMDPDVAYDTFCAESGFATAHGMSDKASTIRKVDAVPVASGERNQFVTPHTPFAPVQSSILSRIEPGAIGSSLVLLALIAGIGYGGWSVLNEVQRVQLAPVEQTPTVLAELDPLEGAAIVADLDVSEGSGVFSPPSDALDRLYRPQALDVPVLIARDAPISTLSPGSIGTFVQNSLVAEILPQTETGLNVPQVIADAAPAVGLMAVRPAWVRVSAADGTVIFEKILNAGESYELPATEDAPSLRAGMSGSIYLSVNGDLYGPVGEGTSTVRGIELAMDTIQQAYNIADFDRDPELARLVAEAAIQGIVVSGE